MCERVANRYATRLNGIQIPTTQCLAMLKDLLVCRIKFHMEEKRNHTNSSVYCCQKPALRTEESVVVRFARRRRCRSIERCCQICRGLSRNDVSTTDIGLCVGV